MVFELPFLDVEELEFEFDYSLADLPYGQDWKRINFFHNIVLPRSYNPYKNLVKEVKSGKSIEDKTKDDLAKSVKIFIESLEKIEIEYPIENIVRNCDLAMLVNTSEEGIKQNKNIDLHQWVDSLSHEKLYLLSKTYLTSYVFGDMTLSMHFNVRFQNEVPKYDRFIYGVNLKEIFDFIKSELQQKRDKLIKDIKTMTTSMLDRYRLSKMVRLQPF